MDGPEPTEPQRFDVRRAKDDSPTTASDEGVPNGELRSTDEPPDTTAPPEPTPDDPGLLDQDLPPQPAYRRRGVQHLAVALIESGGDL